MYKPGRPRPRLTSITRTRSGCMTCRRRKKRCDEGVPRCSACTRLGLDCVPPNTSIKFSPQRSLVGPSPPVSRPPRRERVDSNPDGWTSTRRFSSSKSPVGFTSTVDDAVAAWSVPSPVAQRHSPLLTPTSSYNQVQSSVSPSARRNSLYSRSSFSERQDEVPFGDYEFSDFSLLLEGDWATPPWPFQLDLDTTEPSSSHGREASSHRHESVRQAWFTELPVETETNTTDGQNYSKCLQSHPNMLQGLTKLYMNHWENDVLDILPPIFRDLSSQVEKSEALSSGILALSAAHLGHIHVQVRTKFGKDDEYYVGPNHVHLVYMRQFYDAALRQLSHSIVERSGKSVLILGNLLILMLVEKTVGSFRGEAFHEDGIAKLLSEEFEACSEDPLGLGLIKEWLVLRAQNWSHRIPFTVLSYGKALAETGIDFIPFLSQDAIIPIMLESYHQNTMILFERFVGRGDMESISSRCYRFYHSIVEESRSTTLPWRPVEYPPDDDYRRNLSELAWSLDEWHSGLLLEDRPIESFRTKHASGQSKFLSPSSDPRLFALNPLQFRCHRAAMNYAYYLAARILQSPALIEPWEKGSLEGSSSEDETDWMLLLLRVLLGLEPKTCFEDNIFTIGLSELILIGLLRCPPTIQLDGNENTTSSELFISFAQSVVTTFESRSIFREGHCCLESFRDFVDLYDRLRRECGKSMFFLISGEADTAWTKLYGHGMDTAIVLGRDCQTQKMFGEKVDVRPRHEC